MSYTRALEEIEQVREVLLRGDDGLTARLNLAYPHLLQLGTPGVELPPVVATAFAKLQDRIIQRAAEGGRCGCFIDGLDAAESRALSDEVLGWADTIRQSSRRT